MAKNVCPKCGTPNDENYVMGFCGNCIQGFVMDVLAPNRNDPKPEKLPHTCNECGAYFKKAPSQCGATVGVRCPQCGSSDTEEC